MKRVNVFALLLLCTICTQAQPFRGGLKLRPSTAALHPRVAITRFIAKARAQKPRPIRMRVLPVPVSFKQVPVFPLASHPSEMYRGLALDLQGKELRNILNNGMPVATSHFPIWHGTYDGKAYGENTKALFATTDPLLASTYAQMNRFRTDEDLFLPIVLHLKRVGKDIAPGQERTIEIPHDIPPSWIQKVSALLSIEGQLRWGELELNGENEFLFTPYPLL